MDKKKYLIIAISLLSALIIGIVVYMGVSGKFASLKERFDPSVQTEAGETDDVSEIPGEFTEKKSLPENPTAALFENADETTAGKISGFEEAGFNTAIFTFNSSEINYINDSLSACVQQNICAGIRLNASDISSLSGVDLKNVTFAIIEGDINAENSEKELKDAKSAIEDIEPSIILGFEPSDINTLSKTPVDSFAAITDFLFISQNNETLSEFSDNLQSWYELPCDIFVCFNLTDIDGFSTGEVQNFIDTVSSNSEQAKMLAFKTYEAISSSKSASAQSIKEFIKENESKLLNKEFEVTNHNSTTISTDQPTVIFRGTSSPLYSLKCNGKEIERADNGDFNIDVEVKTGKNTVTFEHKDKTYNYTINYNIDILKSVSPTKELTVPGNMDVEITAVAVDGAKVTLSFNGSTYTMTKSDGSNDEDPSNNQSTFKTYRATVKTPAGKSSVQNLGTFKVTATYSGMSESVTGASVKISAEEATTVAPVRTTARTTTTTTAAETTTEKTETSSESEESDTQSGTAENSSSQSDTTSTRVPHGSYNTTTTTTTKKETEVTATTAKNTLQKYSYTNNYNLGKTTYVEIIDDYVETYPGSNLSTLSSPDCSPFLKGTVDYLSKTATIDSDKYYYVASGYKIPLLREENLTGGKGKVTHLKVVEGYIMPSNSLQILSCTTTNGNTSIEIATNRKVAFNARLLGQSYSDNGSGRMVKVSSVNCTGLQFTFYDTASITGSLSFSGPIVTSGKTSVSGSVATLTLNFASSGKFYGFHYEYNSSGNLIITVKKKPASLSGCTIMLDPGHGGYDGGASCVVSSSAWSEAKINLAIAQKTKELLESEGAKVIMTRTSDSFLSLTARNQLVRQYHPNMFISIHCDASGSSSSSYGTTAYYYRAYSQPLAKYIHSALVSAYNTKIYAGQSKNNVDRGCVFGAYRVARVEECPAILVEYGFVTNTAECQALENASNRAALAQATVKGIKNYIANS